MKPTRFRRRLATKITLLICLLLICSQLASFGWTSLILSRADQSGTPHAAAELRRELRYSAFVVGCVALILAMIAGIVYSETMVLPLRRLTRAAREVARGNFNHSLLSSSQDEVGDLVNSFQQMLHGLVERDQVKAAFSRYHNPEIAEHLLKNRAMLGGARKQAVILFTDLRGFTQFASNFPPEIVMATLNEYFSHMIEIVQAHGGIIDKFVGDAFLALWGIPEGTPDDASRAVECALALREGLTQLNGVRRQRGAPPLKIGMGMDAGVVLAGNVGTQSRMEYTVIGDAVNTASRLQSATKEKQTDLLVSKSVLDRTGNQFSTDKHQMTVRGKDALVEAYIVLGRRDSFRKVS